MIDQVRFSPNVGFDYIVTDNPLATTNPTRTCVTWLNATNGRLYVCTDNTPDANVWVLINGNSIFRGAFIYNTSPQSLAQNGVDLIFASADYDTDGFFDIANPTRLTIPAGVSKVQMSAYVSFTGNSTGSRGLWLRKNGTNSFFGEPVNWVDIDSTIQHYMTITSGITRVVAGDYFIPHAYQNSGGNLNTVTTATLPTWFSIEVKE